MTDEQVEVVAQALYESHAARLMGNFVRWDGLSDATQNGFRDDARGALDAADRAATKRATDIPRPKDGTHALIYIVHENAKYGDEHDVYEWQGWHTATWTDFNNGGWTWHGMMGRITHVRPLPPAPDGEARDADPG